jgi:hypothetical protein
MAPRTCSFDTKIQRNVGRCLSPHVGIDVGIYLWIGRGREGDKSPAKICSSFLAYLAGLRGDVRGQGACVWLNQTELSCTLDGRAATIDVQFSVDALGIGTNRAQADHEFAGDLWPRKLGVEQAEHVELART